MKNSQKSRQHLLYWVPVISSITVILVNLLIALFNPVTTFCITDNITRNSARLVEILVLIMFSFGGVLLLLKKGNLLVLFINITAIGLQFSLIAFITRVNKSEFCNFISGTWAYVGIIITLLGAIVNTGCLYSNYLTSYYKKRKQIIILQLVGSLGYILIDSVLFYWGLVTIYI